MTDTVKNLIIYSMNCKIAQSKLKGDGREQTSTIHNIVKVILFCKLRLVFQALNYFIFFNNVCQWSNQKQQQYIYIFFRLFKTYHQSDSKDILRDMNSFHNWIVFIHFLSENEVWGGIRLPQMSISLRRMQQDQDQAKMHPASQFLQLAGVFKLS